MLRKLEHLCSRRPSVTRVCPDPMSLRPRPEVTWHLDSDAMAVESALSGEEGGKINTSDLEDDSMADGRDREGEVRLGRLLKRLCTTLPHEVFSHVVAYV